MSSHTSELKDRVEAKRKRVEAQIHELKADGNEASRRKAESLQKHMDDIYRTIAEGYNNLKDDAIAKLNQWLKQ